LSATAKRKTECSTAALIGIQQRRARKAANARRYRARFDAGQRVFYVTAVPDRARNMLIGRGRLPPGAYGDAEIELAISTMIDDEGAE
jgi:hypothetical protein